MINRISRRIEWYLLIYYSRLKQNLKIAINKLNKPQIIGNSNVLK